MFSVIRVLTKVIVAKFYERNAGLLFFVFFLMFGIVESTQIISYHKALMYATLTSPIFLLLVCGVWLLYLIKCVQFFLAQLTRPDHTFLFELGGLNFIKRFWVVTLTILLIYEPVLIYSIFIIALGIYSKLFTAATLVVLFHFFGITGASLILSYQLNHAHKLIKILTLPSIQWPWVKPLPLFYINQLTSQLPTVLFFTKAFSVFAIYGFFQIPLDHYDNRIALMGLLFGLAAHSAIVFELRRFEENNLRFLRNLPVPNWKRFGGLAIVYLLLLLPEAAMLCANHILLPDVLGIYLFGAGFILLLHCLLFVELNNDKHLQWTVGLFLISFMLVLFKIYFAETLLLWIFALVILNRHYYQFEKST